jgi:hypothetical protein
MVLASRISSEVLSVCLNCGKRRQSAGVLDVAHDGLNHVSGEPVSRISVCFCGGVPSSTSIPYRVPDRWLKMSTSFCRVRSFGAGPAIALTGDRMMPSPRAMIGRDPADAATTGAKSDTAKTAASILLSSAGLPASKQPGLLEGDKNTETKRKHKLWNHQVDEVRERVVHC